MNAGSLLSHQVCVRRGRSSARAGNAGHVGHRRRRARPPARALVSARITLRRSARMRLFVAVVYSSSSNAPSPQAPRAAGIDGYVAPGRAQHPTAANGKVGGPLTQLMRKKIDDGGFETPLPIEKASGGTGVRTDQAGARIPPIPVAGRRESAHRMGHHLPWSELR